ncbi:MAG: hypothetical protein ACOCRX_12410 [Candidatus Woesearchaeota archaeon]
MDSVKKDVDGFEYILFLILLLLITGNSKTFDSYFQIVDRQTTKISKILDVLSTTANNFHSVLEIPQKEKPEEPDDEIDLQ